MSTTPHVFVTVIVAIALLATPIRIHSFLLTSPPSSSFALLSGIQKRSFWGSNRRRDVTGTHRATTSQYPRSSSILQLSNDANKQQAAAPVKSKDKQKNIVIVGGGWAGLSTAHHLIQSSPSNSLNITLIDASPRIGGLVRDSYTTINSTSTSDSSSDSNSNSNPNRPRPAEAGQHGFWDNYFNIFRLLRTDLSSVLNIDDVLTGYAEQGQYSPAGLEAVWPVYRNSSPSLPTGLAQALYTKFNNLPVLDRMSALPLVLAFSEFDDSPEAWETYDSVSFRDLCVRLGVSRRCYEEAFEPMILTGLFASGKECSAAAALGMAYFFVLRGQNAFDVRWCRGNIGETILDPWKGFLEERGVRFCTGVRVSGLEDGDGDGKITKVVCSSMNNSGGGTGGAGAVGEEETFRLDADSVVFAVGATALNAIVRNTPLLSRHAEFRRFANLRGTSVLATRIYLDKTIDTPYSANACWGFDDGIGMTVFDITKLHSSDGLGGTAGAARIPSSLIDAKGSVMEVDYYSCDVLNVMDDQSILQKVKRDLDTIFGPSSVQANVVDAAIIRLPQAVNWYFPGSYSSMPDAASTSITNLYFAGDIVRSRHGSWSQEKAFVTGMEAANLVLGRPVAEGIEPLKGEEPHVVLARDVVDGVRSFLGGGDKQRGPSLIDFLW